MLFKQLKGEDAFRSIILISSTCCLIHMNITLWEGYRHTFSIEAIFDGPGCIPVNIPIMVGCNPWPDNNIN